MLLDVTQHYSRTKTAVVPLMIARNSNMKYATRLPTHTSLSHISPHTDADLPLNPNSLDTN